MICLTETHIDNTANSTIIIDRNELIGALIAVRDKQKVFNKYPKDHTLIVGDMNIPGFDLKQSLIKLIAQYNILHQQF